MALLPFAANALAFYLYFHFQHFLAVYAVARASSAFYSVVLLLCFTLVIVVQPLASGMIRRMPYALALAVGFTGLAAGLAVLAAGTRAALLAGGALITLGDIVLFLKNDLEALRRSPRSDAVVFGQQRLAAAWAPARAACSADSCTASANGPDTPAGSGCWQPPSVCCSPASPHAAPSHGAAPCPRRRP